MTRFTILALCALLALAADAGAQCDGTCYGSDCTFQGISNTPLGVATLHIDESSCSLVVGNVGSSGQDGVVQGGLSSLYMATGLATPNFSGAILSTSANIRQVGIVDGITDREISELKIRTVSSNLLRLEMDCAAIEVASYLVEIYHDGALVTSEVLVNDVPIMHLPKGDVEAIACACLESGDVYTTVRFGGTVEFTLQTIGGPVGPFLGECVRMWGLSPGKLPMLQTAIENIFKDTGPVSITSLYAGPLPSEDLVCPEAIVPVESTTWGRIKSSNR